MNGGITSLSVTSLTGFVIAAMWPKRFAVEEVNLNKGNIMDYAELLAAHDKLKSDNDMLLATCIDQQKSYSKQHDFYKDIFISLVKVERENEHLKAAAVGECTTLRFKDLPKGARFMYPGGKDVWVVLESYGDGLIAKWQGIDGPTIGQSLCCFVDDDCPLETEVNVIC